MWTSNDSRYVGLHCNWDNANMHGDHGKPMYAVWNKCSKSIMIFLFNSSCSYTLQDVILVDVSLTNAIATLKRSKCTAKSIEALQLSVD